MLNIELIQKRDNSITKMKNIHENTKVSDISIIISQDDRYQLIVKSRHSHIIVIIVNFRFIVYVGIKPKTNILC